MQRTLALITPLVSGLEAGWQWVDMKGSMCLSGEETGIWVRKSSGKNLGIYLYGGGACWNTITCDTATQTAKPGNPGSSGIFDSRSDNPLAEYNWIGVPYCTGDVHAGDNEAKVAGKDRHFNGVSNLKLLMSYATDNFKEVETLFVTGESAGGFGATASYVTIRDYYPDARGVLMDDSGPILDDTALAPCLQEEWRKTWNLNKNLPTDCPCAGDEGNLVTAWSYGKQRYPKDSFSLISSQSDSTISTFFAFGLNKCRAILPVGYKGLQAGLERLSKTVPVYQIPGSSHTHTSSSEFFSRTVNSMPLYKWIDQLIDGSRPDPSSVEPTAQDLYDEMRRNSDVNSTVSTVV